MIRLLSIFLCISLSLQGMDNQAQADFTPTLPDELTYKIIDLWPALNVYRLINKRWHALTSYTQADAIVKKLGSKSLGKSNAQELLFKYIKKNDIELASNILARKYFKNAMNLSSSPLWYKPSTDMQAILGKYITYLEEKVYEKEAGNIFCEAVAVGDLSKVIAARNTDADVLERALGIAIMHNHHDIIQFLLGTEEIDFTEQFPHIMAATSGDITTIGLVCKKKPASDARAFRQAINRGRLESAKLFYQCGAKNMKKYYRERKGLLYDACVKGRGEMVEFLLAQLEVNPNDLDPSANHKKSANSLWAAVTENHLEIAQKLIARGATANWGAKNKKKTTPLMQAVYNGNLDMVQLLVKAGAQIWEPKFKDKNAYEIAHELGHTHITQWLEEHKPNT